MPKQMLISEFKARCAAEMKRVRQTGQPLIVTLRGKPIARVEAIHSPGQPAIRLGAKRGHARFTRDLVKVDFSREWEMNH